ncbi:MAG: cupin domain-containing protein [Desulfurococcaceae archaeon]
MPVYNSKEIPGYTVPQPNEREVKAILAPQLNNCDKATVTLVIIPPNSSTGMHLHKTSDEIAYIVRGKGEYIEEIDGEKLSMEVNSGMVLHAKAGVRHGVINTGVEPLEIFCVFIPPLPEEGPVGEAIRRRKPPV